MAGKPSNKMRPAELLNAMTTTCRLKTLILSLATLLICQITTIKTVPVGYPQSNTNLHALSTATRPAPDLPTQHHQLFNLDQLGPQQRQQLQLLHQQQISPQLQKQLLQQSQQQQQLQQATMYQTPKSNQYTTATYELLLDLRHQMMTSQFKFDDHFKELLSRSKVALHTLFLDTYGILYEKNAAIFTSLFDSLEQYYLHGQVKLTKSMENFFLALYQKIFVAYNLGYEFNSQYLDCTSQQLNQLRPFGDMPDKMIAGLKHGFVAARTFNQVLSDGIDVIKDIVTLGPLTQCNQMINDKLLKNTLIGTANLQTTKVPCPQFCEQVVRRCIGNGTLEGLSEKWKGYVIALADLSKKMTTSYNIETIIAPLSLHLSEAIMTFQENGKNISQHLFNTCGKPVISEPASLHPSPSKPTNINTGQSIRRLVKRAANMGPAPVSVRNSQHILGVNQHLGPSQSSHFKIANKDIMSSGTSSLDDLTQIGQSSPIIDEIKNHMLSTKYFWHNLPKAVCMHNSTLGANISKIKSNQDCFQEKFTVYDVNSDIRYRNEMLRHINRLDGMRSRIESALNGVEIDWSASQPTLGAGLYQSIVQRPSPIPSTTTSTTTTIPGLGEDEEDCEEGDDCDMAGEFSGDGKNDESVTTDDLSLDPDTVTEDPDDADDPHSETSPTDESTSDESFDDNSTTQNPDPDNEIDRPTTPQDNDLITNLIDAPNQPGAQTKSSQSSSKLVIDTHSHILLATLMLITISFVTHFHIPRIKTISEQR